MRDGSAGTFTVDDALESMGFGKFQALALAYSGIGYAAEAMEIMILSFIGTAVQAEWNLSSGQESLITSVVFAGELLGAYSWGVVSDNYGRRKGFLFTALVTAGAGFLSAFAPNYISLMILRFVVGIGLGGGPVLLSWFLEFVPTPNRGHQEVNKVGIYNDTHPYLCRTNFLQPHIWYMLSHITLVQITICVQPFLCGQITHRAFTFRYSHSFLVHDVTLCPASVMTIKMWIFPLLVAFLVKCTKFLLLLQAIIPRLGWRWLLTLSAIPSFLLLLFYGVVPESPRYLCLNGRTDDAMLVLENVARVNEKPLPYGTLVSEHKEELHEKLNPPEDEHLIPELNHVTVNEDAESKRGGIYVLYWILSPTLIRTTLLLWMDFFGNAFAYYGIVLLTTELVNKKKCSVMLHSNQAVDANSYKDVFITSFAEFPGLLLSAVIVDRVGRKLSMLAMLSLSGIFLIPLLFHQTEVLTTVLLFGGRSCVTGSINTLYIYAPEVYPTSVRGTGFGIACSMGRIGGIIAPLVAVGLVEGCRQTEAVLLFELVILLSGMAVFFFPFETKGRELSDSI